MIVQKLDNILDYYDTIQEYYDSLLGKFESAQSVREASGQRTSLKNLLDQYAVSQESLNQIREKKWAYQTGTSVESLDRTSAEVRAELEKTIGTEALNSTTQFIESAKYKDYYENLLKNNADEFVKGLHAGISNAYDIALKSRERLDEKLAEYNQALLDKKALQEELKQAKKDKDKDQQNYIKMMISDVQAVIDKNKLIKVDKQNIKALDKELAGWDTITSSSDFYKISKETLSEYEGRRQELEQLKEDLAGLQSLKKDKEYMKSLDSSEKKDLNKEISDIKKQIKSTKLTKKEEKNEKYLQERINILDEMDDPNASRVTAENWKKEQDLKARRDRNKDLSDQLADIYYRISDEYRLDVIKDLKQQAKDLNKELKKKENKWSKADEKLYTALVNQRETLEEINNNAMVDDLTAQTANYKELVAQIGAIEEKKNLKAKDQENRAMYLDELNEINSGVLAEDIVKFRDKYEKWWGLNRKLETKGVLSEKENLQKKNLEDSMATMHQSYQDYIKDLQDELRDSLMVENPKTKEDFKQNLERTQEALKESYESQQEGFENAYKNTNRYREIYSKWATAEQKVLDKQSKIDEAKRKGKSTKKLAKDLEKLEATRDKYQEELDALAKGATEENIANYIEAWEYVRKNKDAYENSRLTKKAADTYEKYRLQLDRWDKEKADELKGLNEELADKLKEVQLEYDTNLGKIEAEENEKLEEMWNLAKQIAEWEANSLQSTIDKLDAMIQRYQALANMLNNTSFDSLKKYNVMDLLDLDEAKSRLELIRDQYEQGISYSEVKIGNLVKLAGVYRELLESAQVESKDDPNHFQSILSKYYNAEETTDKMRKALDDVATMLNNNNYTANDWIKEWNSNLQEAINSIIDAVDNVQELKDQLRENVIFKAANQAIESLTSLNTKLAAMAGVIEDNWVIVGEGLTEYGLTKINLLGQQMKNTQKQVEAYAEKLKLIDEIQNDPEKWKAEYGSEEAYLQARNDAITNYYNSLQEVENIAYDIYNLGKQADEARVESLKKITNEYKNALAQKKEYYEYDKNIKAQTKDIEALKAQIEALNGVKVRPFYFNCGKILRA